MGKSRILVFSILIVLACGTCVAANDDNVKRQKLGWSRNAATEAEAVAAISCSGHGNAYLDGLVEDGKPVCECHLCYGGPDCSQLLPDCSADAGSGDPLFLEPFWMKRARSSAIVISGWHRMSYNFPDQSYISKRLENRIRRLHSIAKNAVTEGKYLIFGAGSSQLLTAAVFALSINNNSSSPVRIAAQPPFYPVYKTQTDYFETSRFRFDGTLLQENSSNTNGAKVIEFVCSPNNPDGNLRTNVLQGPSVSTIHDYAYYWPHFTPIPAPADDDLMIFTLSKLTGHAGSRLGWALVKDKTTYDNMVNYMEIASLGTSRETQLRALQLFNTILRTNGTEIFDFAYNTMRRRWNLLNEIISPSKRFSLQKIPPRFCTYFEKVRGASPAYAWVKCEREEDRNCTKVFEEAKISGRGGRVYYDDESYIRLALIRGNDDFNLLLKRLSDLVSKEKI
ncbi:hypothetical protein ACS0TY_017608 [Phlomoides rotata]